MKKTMALAGIVINIVFLVVIASFFLTPGKSGKPSARKSKVSSRKASTASKKISGAVLKISSKPSGAKIYINGYYKGKTPGSVVIGSVSKSPGEYTVKVAMEGYIPYEEKVRLIRGDRKRYRVVLKSKKK